jgi:hypothetical protein
LQSPPTLLTNLTNYKSSRAIPWPWRTRGTHLFVCEKSTGQYRVCSGAIVQTTHDGWAADTGDSGLAPFLTQIQQCELAAYTKGSAQEVVNFVLDNGRERAKPAEPESRCTSLQAADNLFAVHRKTACAMSLQHCRILSKSLGQAIKEISFSWPDLLVPSILAVQRTSATSNGGCEQKVLNS